jgi:hypothetical protein
MCSFFICRASSFKEVSFKSRLSFRDRSEMLGSKVALVGAFWNTVCLLGVRERRGDEECVANLSSIPFTFAGIAVHVLFFRKFEDAFAVY